MIQVLICDDQDIVRKGLQIILNHSPGLEVIGLAENGEEAVQFCASRRPDVVLMDLKMPILNGIQATRKITQAYPQTKVVVLTTYDADEWVFEAIRAGASGYLLKDTDSEEIITAIQEAHEGRVRLDSQIAGKVLEAFKQMAHPAAARPDEPPLEQLTERENSILHLMVQGKTNKEIAETLFLAEGTVKNNVSNIFSKLHANDRTQAVISALRRGLAKLE